MSVRKGQARLSEASVCSSRPYQIQQKTPSFLSSALSEIASGGDANAALGVKAKRENEKGSTIGYLKMKTPTLYVLGYISDKPIDRGSRVYQKSDRIAKEF